MPVKDDDDYGMEYGFGYTRMYVGDHGNEEIEIGNGAGEGTHNLGEWHKFALGDFGCGDAQGSGDEHGCGYGG